MRSEVTPFKLALLSLNDKQALLEFEKTNQSWFEAYIPARENGFYTQTGITKHINECLDFHGANEMLPMLIKSRDNHLLGRINLHSIDLNKRTAHLGYRIAQTATGQGITTLATKEISALCESNYQLKTIIALTASDNLASQKVLIRNAFDQIRTRSNYMRLNGQLIHCIEYHKSIHYS
ncbi:GNAT family N-acetyltransferase [Vibrio sp. ZSDE26]|uniref:GNAT family N-acetyltransferase n=1 Tax=Vibrio amylolyticus TaxID=2847292 RepID=A0A9X1XS32_9VIBR|nr:GNAT family N-acetyltransferase [Vibrio amylolyticus]MCK6264549.1 GNAT family N-acetyltransferase [Vibrio amylolyticus]